MQKASKELHFTVGLFVLTTTLCIILFSFWIAGTSTQKMYRKYILFFNESVYGVNIGTEVNYKGFQVGKVSDISLNPHDPEHIKVIIEIEPNTPIKEDSRATLKPKGITGLTFIEIIGGSKDAEILKTSKKEKYPIIKTADSLIGKVTVGVPELIDNLLGLSQRLSKLFNDENVKSIEASLKNIEEITKSIESQKKELEQFMISMSAVAQNIEATTGKKGELTKTIKKINRTFSEVEKILIENKSNLSTFSGAALKELTNTLRSTRKAADEIEGLAENLKDDPSQLFFSPSEKGYRIPK